MDKTLQKSITQHWYEHWNMEGNGYWLKIVNKRLQNKLTQPYKQTNITRQVRQTFERLALTLKSPQPFAKSNSNSSLPFSELGEMIYRTQKLLAQTQLIGISYSSPIATLYLIWQTKVFFFWCSKAVLTFQIFCYPLTNRYGINWRKFYISLFLILVLNSTLSVVLFVVFLMLHYHGICHIYHDNA